MTHFGSLLNGIRILDFSRLLPGPLGTMMLKDLGADVTKIERSSNGDWLKFYNSEEKEVSPYYKCLNEGKTVHTLDFEKADDRDFILKMIAEADILIEQYRPGAMDHFGFGFNECIIKNPRLIYISVTGYGQHDERRNKAGHDLNYMAESGLLSLITGRSEFPVIPSIQLADVAASYGIVNACLQGLIYRSQFQKGIHMDFSIEKNLAPFGLWAKIDRKEILDNHIINDLNGGLVNYNLYLSSDGEWIAFAALELKFWNHFCEVVAKPHWKRQNLKALRIEVFDKKQVEELLQVILSRIGQPFHHAMIYALQQFEK